LYWLVLGASGRGGIAVSGARAPAPLSGPRPKAELSFRIPKRFARKAGWRFATTQPSHPSFLACHFDLHTAIMA